MVPEAVPPCLNSSFPAVPVVSAASREALSEMFALPAKIRSPPWVLSFPDESVKLFARVRSVVTLASLKSLPFVERVARDIGAVLESIASPVRDRFVLVLVNVSATASVPASDIAALVGVIAAPLTAVPPAGRIKVPPSMLTFAAAPTLTVSYTHLTLPTTPYV